MTNESSDRAAIWAAVLDMYEGFLAGDRARIDQHIADEATIWDSEEPDLAVGKHALNEIRARRPADDTAPKVADLVASDPVIDVWGDVGLCRHLLRVRFVDDASPVQRVRNTGVWRRIAGRWQIVHNHEDVLVG